MAKDIYIVNQCVDPGIPDGVAFVAQASPLTRLHYFDGQYLRADALALEQDYLRARNRLSNLAGGWGVVDGMGLSLAGSSLQVSAGLAITPAGNPVLAVNELSAALADLLKLATTAPAAGNADFADCPTGKKMTGAAPATLAYVVTVGPVDSLCGNEAVYGKLCASACATDSQHPWWREGVALRLRPIELKLPDSSAVTLGSAHLRNRAASAYFAVEPGLTASALSGAGLAGTVWCNPASLYDRDEVPLGLLLMEGGTVRVLDAWSARRERMDAQARGYWQGRMAMRPWNVFLAQILQFQCQLSAIFDGTTKVLLPADDCDRLRQLLDRTRQELDALHRQYSAGTQTILRSLSSKPSKQEAENLADEIKLSYAQLYDIAGKLGKADLGKGVLPRNRLLLNAGFVELPPAGYLPVATGRQSLEDQLSRMFGEGVDLTYRAVRHDEIAHLVEEAQHMERISLTRGLDDPKRKEAVEIFVPDGQAVDAKAAAPGIWWQVDMAPEIVNAFQLGLATDQNRLQATLELVKDQFMKAKLDTAKTDTTGAGQPLDAATRKATLTRTDSLLNALKERHLYGLARSEVRDDGSWGLTLVARLDAADLYGQMRMMIDTYPKLDTGGSVAQQIDRIANAVIYLAADIASDPFGLAFGAEAAVKAELRVDRTAYQATGSLTALYDRPLGNGRSERVVELSLTVADAAGKLTQAKGRISLARKGDAADGQLVLDDARHDPANSPDFITWSDAPRTATLSVLADAGKPQVALRYMMKMDTSGNVAAPAEATASADTLGARRQLMTMNGLDGMPAVASPIGAAAMNALTGLADVGNDSAFLARASRRLFPAPAASGTATVRAVLDWVMFRRARTALCCLPAASPAGTGLETFQVWHLALADKAEAAKLAAALDKNDTKTLAGYSPRFQRVGVLRYRDQNSVSEEPAYQVQAMWRLADPGPQVALGRYWEAAPVTGQSWQNHFRLTSMLDQIAGFTQPPPAGSGAIAGLTAVSPPLADGTLDGGFLVVTLTQALKLKPQRVILAYYSYYRELQDAFKQSPDEAWKKLLEFAKKKPADFIDLSLKYVSNTQMDSASLQSLQNGDTRMLSVHADFGFQLLTLRVDAKVIDAESDPVARHKVVTDNVGKSQTITDRSDEGSVQLAATDLGGGAQTASLVFYFPLVAN
jgi:hypothetical protein